MFYQPSTGDFFESVQAFLLANKDTSFGDMYAKTEREAVGLFDVDETRPPYDHDFQECAPVGVAFVDGQYVMQYDITEKQLTAAERLAVMVQRCDAALSNHLDTTAQARRYDNRITCALRAGSPGPFQSEGVAFASWMDACNALAYQFLSEVQAGTRPVPSSTQELIDALPAMVWPA